MFDFEDDEDETTEDQLKRQSLTSEVYAARKSSDWRDFVNTGKKWDHEDKSKRVRRMLMVGKAMEALEDIPV